MSDGDSDFAILLGPDRRKIPRPTGLGFWVLILGLVIAVGMVLLWPSGERDFSLVTFGFADDIVEAEVTESVVGPCSYAADLKCRYFEFQLVPDDGAEVLSGKTVFLEFPDEQGQPDLEAGDIVFLAAIPFEDGTVDYQYTDRDRRPVLVGLAVLFAVSVIMLGRLRGFAALVGLALSVAILLGFIIPAIIEGRDAVLVALVGGGAIALVSLYLAHGYTPLTHVAAIGAFSALALTTALSWAVVAIAEFTGLGEEESFYLLDIPDLNLSGLLLAGIVLGTLGALDDVTVTQASAVWEVHNANADLSESDLYRSGIRVGRDHIASTVNTLLLAYAGASMPLLILFSLSNQAFGVISSTEVVAVEIVRTLVGSIGLVAAVPLTTWLGSRVVKKAAPGA